MSANAETAIALADELVSDALQFLNESCRGDGRLDVGALDDHQQVLYDLRMRYVQAAG